MGRDMGNQAKRHHIVSTFYLRHFADEAERITTVMLPGAMPLGNRVDHTSPVNQRSGPCTVGLFGETSTFSCFCRGQWFTG